MNKKVREMLLELPGSDAKAYVMPIVERKALLIDASTETRRALRSLDTAWTPTGAASSPVKPPRALELAVRSANLRPLVVALRQTVLEDSPQASEAAEQLLRHLKRAEW